MRARLSTAWFAILGSLWFVPAVMTCTAVLLALLTVEVDRQLSQANWQSGFHILFGGGVEGARGVLDAISGTMITVTGVVFSLTVVALQLASTQFTPRVLRNFTGDRANQLVLGVFIGTFTYSLLVQRTVQSQTEGDAPFVPAIGVSVAIVLVLVSVACLIYYIHHVTRSIQASVIIDRVAHETNGLIHHLFPEPIGEADEATEEVVVPDEPPAIVTSEVAGYLQAVDADTLFDLAQESELVICMQPPVGEFVLPGAALATVWPAHAKDERLVTHIRRAFVLGPERTIQHDLEFGIQQLVDIAVKALSPGVNDPTTAVTCIDRLGEVLVNLANRLPPPRVRRDEEGRVRFIARETTFDEALEQSFSQIRHYGSKDAVVMVHLLETLGRIAAVIPDQLKPPVSDQIHIVLESSEEISRVSRDDALVHEVGKRALAKTLHVPTRAGFRPWSFKEDAAAQERAVS